MFNILYNDKMENCQTISRLKLWMGPRRCQRKRWAFKIVFLCKILIFFHHYHEEQTIDKLRKMHVDGMNKAERSAKADTAFKVSIHLRSNICGTCENWLQENDIHSSSFQKIEFKVSLHVRSNYQRVFEEPLKTIYSSSF